MDSNVLFALLLTLFAGLATGIGSLIAFLSKQTNHKFLSFSLGFSAGVMIYISFMEMLFSARIDLADILADSRMADTVAVAAFFGGIIIAAIIDKLIPEAENPHELHDYAEIAASANPHHHTLSQAHSSALRRTGIVTALTVAIHNFPEGIATFMSAYSSLEVGIPIAIAIAIHNIPEGIAVSVPIYCATSSRRKAFWYSMMSGFAEPLGAVIGFFILMPFITPMLMCCVMAVVAGIMVYISIDELLPAAHEYGYYHIAIYGLIGGMAVMAMSLILLK